MRKMIDRTGEVRRMNNGMMATIIGYRRSRDIDIQFEDGTILYHMYYDNFKKGYITNPNCKIKSKTNRLEETRRMNNGMMATIITYRSCKDIDVKFEDGTIVYKKRYEHFKNGSIVNPNYIQYSKLGETRKMNNGMLATIITYRTSMDIDVQFEDGTIVYHKIYDSFKKGKIANPNYIQNSRLGEIRKMNNGMLVTIIAYRTSIDIDVQFEDGTIVYHKTYDSFRKGAIANPNYKIKSKINRLGETRRMNNGMMATIIAYQNNTDVDIQFEDGTIVYHKTYGSFKKGEIANPNYKLMNQTSINELICAFYLEQIGFKKKKNMKELNGKELDLYHSNLNGCKIGIEYDGYKHSKQKDLEKNKLCKQNNIQLYRIRESYLSKLKSTSIDFTLSDNKPRSRELEQTLQLLIKDISLTCNISIPLSIDFQKDDKNINKFLKKYHNKYEKERLYKQKKMNNGMLATIIAYRTPIDIDVQFEDGAIVYHKTYYCFKKGAIANPNYIQNSRLGEIRKMNNDMLATIIVYRTSMDIDVQFEDGTIVYHKSYSCFKKGAIANPNYIQNSRLGEIRKMNNDMLATIIAYRSFIDIDIQFADGTIVYHKSYNDFKRGYISNPNYKDKKQIKKTRLGEIMKMNNGQMTTIITYRSSNDIDVKFEDGTIVRKKRYEAFKNGNISNPNYNKHCSYRLDEIRQMNNGMIAKIIVYRNSQDIDIEFEDGTIVRNKNYGAFKNGSIRNPNYKIKNGELIAV